MSWHNELMATCGAEPLVTCKISRRLAAVHKVLSGVALQTTMKGHSELELHVEEHEIQTKVNEDKLKEKTDEHKNN